MKKRIICLFGGPGTGKSTTAAGLFALMKCKNLNVELVREYVKDWVWEERSILPGDQSYISAKQSRKERICVKGNDYIITDSPLYINAFYEEQYEPTPHIGFSIIEKQKKFLAKNNFDYFNIFLTRVKQYNPRGRFQTKEEAIDIDNNIRGSLVSHKVPYVVVTADENAPKEIYNILVRENIIDE